MAEPNNVYEYNDMIVEGAKIASVARLFEELYYASNTKTNHCNIIV